MAGDWVKMRVDLIDDPAVIAMASALEIDGFAVIGRLHNLWAWANVQSRDGHAPGVTAKWVDLRIGVEGFADAMCKVGWLQLDDSGLTIPNFDRHNGDSAKTRALATDRKRRQRAGAGRGEHGAV